jgi:hypothetical protein
MILNVAGKNIGREFVALLVCLFVLANAVQGTVLCYGYNGHVEFESAFHEQCTCHGHSDSGHSTHDEDKNCHQGQCVDIPVDFGYIQISQTTEQLDRTFAAIDMDAIVAILPFVCSEYDPVAGECHNPSYFSPLRIIILLA